MDLNPQEYDIGELRDAAGASTLSSAPAGDAEATADALALDEALRRAAGEEGPYLDALPRGYAAELLVFDWLELLVARGGVIGALNALDYYEDVGWLSDPVENRLRDYLTGFRDDGGVETEPDTAPELPVEAHRASLRYVARLAQLAED